MYNYYAVTIDSIGRIEKNRRLTIVPMNNADTILQYIHSYIYFITYFFP